MRAAVTLAGIVLAACGGTPAPRETTGEVEHATASSVQLARAPAAALGEVHARSFLMIQADGRLELGRMDQRGGFDVGTFRAVGATDVDLATWTDVSEPPIPRTPPSDLDRLVVKVLELRTRLVDGVPCGRALRLDGARGRPVALLIPDANADARAVLEAWEAMPRPTVLVARGDDGVGRALRLVLDRNIDIESTHATRVTSGARAELVIRQVEDHGADARRQTAVTLDDGVTAQDLLAVLGGLAAAGVAEVVLDRGGRCQDDEALPVEGPTDDGDWGRSVGGVQ